VEKLASHWTEQLARFSWCHVFLDTCTLRRCIGTYHVVELPQRTWLPEQAAEPTVALLMRLEKELISIRVQHKCYRMLHVLVGSSNLIVRINLQLLDYTQVVYVTGATPLKLPSPSLSFCPYFRGVRGR
jgi:hypothetical protein